MKASLYIGNKKVAVCESVAVSFQHEQLPKKSKDRIGLTWIEHPYIYIGIKNNLHAFWDTLGELIIFI